MKDIYYFHQDTCCLSPHLRASYEEDMSRCNCGLKEEIVADEVLKHKLEQAESRIRELETALAACDPWQGEKE